MHYLTDMAYIAVLPSLIFGLALAVEDIRRFRVPRTWVAIGVLIQLAVFLALAIVERNPAKALLPLGYALLSAAIQFLLSRFKPGALGFGDVTASFLIGLAVGSFDLMPYLYWWLLMGVLGLLWIHLYPKLAHHSSANSRKAPFVPVITASAIIAILLTTI
ncbi:prepilin peptidase [Bifidobacterium sp. ESL0732]|uniref:prepilin peptidase n=1 Tax=Bifidobacterium sp. ESL0732 TaxID=2983222 RepID=UPI0023F7C98B|nr:prepilin peptidase [Bifidobacterium sp. ESL0732]WEV64743.1 prepilin peptidase [Bifidobacterium sp. ESL0732]